MSAAIHCTIIGFRRLATALCALLGLNAAHAELGGTSQGTHAGTAYGVQHAQLRGAVLMRSKVDEGGTTINEYASANGQIFAYTWRGPTMPDLQTLLGKYAAPYRLAAADHLATDGSLHAAHVESAGIVVESGGQMRSYSGRAWIPAALPVGVSPDELH